LLPRLTLATQSLVCLVNRTKQFIELRSLFDGPQPVKARPEQAQVALRQKSYRNNSLPIQMRPPGQCQLSTKEGC